MKVRRLRALSASLVVMLAVCSLPIWMTMREMQRQQRNQAFLAAIADNDMPRILRLLDEGADLNTRKSEQKPPDFWATFRAIFRPIKPKLGADKEPEMLPTALAQIYAEEPIAEDDKLLAGSETRAHIVRALEAKRQRAELKAILDRLANGGPGDLAALAASEGILIVRHHMDRELTEKLASPYHEPVKIKHAGKHADTANDRLSLNGWWGIVYVEEEIMFAPDEFDSDAFQRVFAFFQTRIRETLESPRYLTISLNLKPSGYYPHYIGPAAQDNWETEWRVYFVQQEEQWRIWKLELEMQE